MPEPVILEVDLKDLASGKVNLMSKNINSSMGNVGQSFQNAQVPITNLEQTSQRSFDGMGNHVKDFGRLLPGTMGRVARSIDMIGDRMELTGNKFGRILGGMGKAIGVFAAAYAGWEAGKWIKSLWEGKAETEGEIEARTNKEKDEGEKRMEASRKKQEQKNSVAEKIRKEEAELRLSRVAGDSDKEARLKLQLEFENAMKNKVAAEGSKLQFEHERRQKEIYANKIKALDDKIAKEDAERWEKWAEVADKQLYEEEKKKFETAQKELEQKKKQEIAMLELTKDAREKEYDIEKKFQEERAKLLEKELEIQKKHDEKFNDLKNEQTNRILNEDKTLNGKVLWQREGFYKEARKADDTFKKQEASETERYAKLRERFDKGEMTEAKYGMELEKLQEQTGRERAQLTKRFTPQAMKIAQEKSAELAKAQELERQKQEIQRTEQEAMQKQEAQKAEGMAQLQKWFGENKLKIDNPTIETYLPAIANSLARMEGGNPPPPNENNQPAAYAS